MSVPSSLFPAGLLPLGHPGLLFLGRRQPKLRALHEGLSKKLGLRKKKGLTSSGFCLKRMHTVFLFFVFMLKIRLQCFGAKGARTYRMVVAPAAARRDGRFVEGVGHYDPKTKKGFFRLDRIDEWVSKGAQFTDTAHSLVKAFRAGRIAPVQAG